MSKNKQRLLEAIELGDISRIEKYSSFVGNLNFFLGRHSTPLLKAISCNNPEVVKLLLDKGADANFCSESGATPLSNAALLGNILICKNLVTNGANVNPESSSPLLSAAIGGRVEVVKYLISANANAKYIMPMDDSNILQHLLDFLDDEDGDVLAIQKEEFTAIIESLIKAGADVNYSESTMHLLPLSIACRIGDMDIIALLIKSGAQVNAISDHMVEFGTALDVAIKCDNNALVEWLRAHGAKTAAELAAANNSTPGGVK
jgi:ankyrin repeat protein